MNLLALGWSPANDSSPRGRAGHVIGFERAASRERVLGGRLTYIAAGLLHTIEAGMTWEALAQLRAAATRRGVAIDDERIVQEVLMAWAGEALAQSGRDRIAADGPLVLSFSGGPLSAEPDRLCRLAGLA